MHAWPSAFTAAEIEAGRKLFAGDWHFFWAAAALENLPKMAGLEIAFAGRSNVGKSSLINALTGRKALARTSNTPGRTQELIFFEKDAGLRLVDMPGYGYAEAPKDKVAHWTELIHAYLKGRANLARVYVLIDARHGLKETDRPMLELLGRRRRQPPDRADQGRPLESRPSWRSASPRSRRRSPGVAAAFPDVLVTSARDGSGIPELRAAIARLVAERR